jgi:hypothetical protein
MILIAHRGQYDGPNKTAENSPTLLAMAMKLGYDCEVDLWVVDDTLYLGHDEPVYKTYKEFINNEKFWIHAKNLEALLWLKLNMPNSKFFWHENDKFVLTSNNIIWTNPGNPLTEKSVMVMPEIIDPSLENTKHQICFAICSDYVSTIKEFYK